jgi:hypothetical protein
MCADTNHEDREDALRDLGEKNSPEGENERRKQLRKFAAESYDRSTTEETELDALTQEGIEWLQEKWGDDAPECPYCSTALWYVSAPVVFPTVVPDGGTLFPVFPVVCTNCGHTTLVSAVKSGIVPYESES